MKNKFSFLLITLMSVLAMTSTAYLQTSRSQEVAAAATGRANKPTGQKIIKTNEEWRQLLSAEQFYILREKGTEKPYTGALLNNKAKGTYHCAACDNALFSSSAKYESNTGWPSFWQPIAKDSVREEIDDSLGERRTEVVCNRCDSHLGHVFDDGPEPTGLRYCMNSIALKFKKKR